MAALAAQVIARVGVAPTFAAAAGGGDTCPCGTNTFIEVKNGSGAPITVTLATNPAAAQFAGVPLATETFSVPATTGDIIYGPISPQLFADVTDGLCHITYSGVTSLTIGVFSVSAP